MPQAMTPEPECVFAAVGGVKSPQHDLFLRSFLSSLDWQDDVLVQPLI